MADGGASAYIMLISALLVSSSASVVLIQEWSSTSRVIQDQQRGLQITEELGIDFAGDPMNVNIDRTGTDHEITFYVMNVGEHPMDETQMEVLIDGLSIASTSITTSLMGTPTPTEWNPNGLLEISVSDNAFNSYVDDTDISIFVTARSEPVAGFTSSASFAEEVRLNG
ncbi:MAG: hypothetical protein L7U62_03910 [Candidatus Poseidoniaceae archaeon]|nr:hypothetical protein [Candidatus Poseidoniaceae archaeon]